MPGRPDTVFLYSVTMSDGISWLEGLSSRGIRPGLETITELLSELGDPQNSVRTIHVAGSDGKGSVCMMLESILAAAGLRVGAFTSPHILRVNESVRIGGEDVSDDLLNSYLAHIKEVCERKSIEATNFEALTACAFSLFAGEKVDIAIIETGMGGRLDATNVITPEVTVINHIGLEHKAFLGDTIQDIACHKAGIMKPSVPCITMNPPEVLEVLNRYSREIGCELIAVDPSVITITDRDPCGITMRYGCDTFYISSPGSYQARNAALAIEAVRRLQDSSKIDQFIRIGLSEVRIPFRMERIPDTPYVIDVTHTPAGAELLKDDILALYGKVTLVTAMLSDKDMDNVARILSPVAKEVLVSSPSSPRAADAASLASLYRKYHEHVTVYPTIADALEAAPTDGIVLVTGSFRTAEDCIRWLTK